MTRGKKAMNNSAGMTIIELMVTTALLMIIIVPVMNMLITGTRTSSASYELNAAAITAQLRMEELVGMTRKELCDEFVPAGPIGPTIEKIDMDYNGFRVKAEVTFDYTVSVGTPEETTYPELAEAVVTVYGGDGSVLCTQTNILNVGAFAGEEANGEP